MNKKKVNQLKNIKSSLKILKKKLIIVKILLAIMITFLNKKSSKNNKINKKKNLNQVGTQYFIRFSVVILKTVKLIEDFEIYLSKF